MNTLVGSIARMAFKQSIRVVKERNILERPKTKHNKAYAKRWESLHELRIIELANTVIALNSVKV